MRARKWWIAAAAPVVAAALVLPFILERSARFYTDGARVREPAAAAGDAIREVLWEPPRPLAEPIDLPDEDEYEPRVSPAGDLLVFTRGRPGENADLWMAERERGGWSDPAPLLEIDSPQDELGAAFSPDGGALLFYSNRPGGRGGYDIWVSLRAEKGWGEPRNAGPAVNGPQNETGPALSADGSTLWFSSDRGDGSAARSPWRGTLRETSRTADYDIYSAAVKRWPPGAEVAGEGAGAAGDPFEGVFADAARAVVLSLAGSSEGSVAVSPAGDFLWFASNRPGGLGGFDLYRARLHGGAPEPPQNLGPQVNTAGDELDPALASGGFELWFARAGDAGREDLFVTVSREVYLSRESAGPWLSASAAMGFVRGVLVFLASFGACLFLFWLLHRRLVTLNLLARCFVFALLIHLLLALWMNRTEVAPKVFEAFGGHSPAGDPGAGAEQEVGVALGDALEEEVGLAIRDALAETGGDAPPALPAGERKVPAVAAGDAPVSDSQSPPGEAWTPPLGAAALPGAPPAGREPPAALELRRAEAPLASLPRAPEPAWPMLEGEPRPEPPGAGENPVAPAVALPVPERPAQTEAPAGRPAPALAGPERAGLPEAGGAFPPAPPQEFVAVEVARAAPAPALPAKAEEISEPEIGGSVSRTAAKPEPEAAGVLPSEQVAMEAPGRAGAKESAQASAAPAGALTRALDPEPGVPGAGNGALPRDAAASGGTALFRDTAPSRDLLGRPPGLASGKGPPGGALPPLAPAELEPRAPEIRGSKRAPAATAGAGGLGDADAGEAVAKAGGGLPPLERRRAGEPGGAGESGGPGGTGEALPGAGLVPFAAARPGGTGEDTLSGSGGGLVGAIGRLTLPSAKGDSPKAGARSGDGGGTGYQPKLYDLRKGSARKEAVRAGGGTEATERAVERGLSWLALHQSPDGRWSLRDYASHLPEPSARDLIHPDWDGRGRFDSRGGGGTARDGDTAATGLAILAFLGHGDSHLEAGRYREAVSRGLAWLVKCQRPNGDLRRGGNLYMHAIASFALCEAYAFTRDPALRDPAQRAIDFTVRSQNPQRGGWRYQPYPQSNEVDTSVFGWMLMALKSGRAGALRIDEQCLERAASYLESARMPGEGGRYAYQPGSRRTTLAMTAQGFFCQEMLADTLPAWRNANEFTIKRSARESADYLLANLPRAADQDGVNYYYWYYATLALFQEGGEAWTLWNRTLSELLLKLQLSDEWGSATGSWDPRDRRASQGGRICSTAMAILSLEVYYRYTRVKGK